MPVRMVFLSLCGVFFVGSAKAQQDYGLCSQVFQMQQYCASRYPGSGSSSPDVRFVEGPVGKAGPRGSRGPAGIVDYAVINETMQALFEERYQDIDEKLANYDRELRKTSEAIFGTEKHTDSRPVDCKAVSREKAKIRQSQGGVFDIYPEANTSYEVYCDHTTDGGGWAVFQRRMDGSIDFFRGWTDYVNGFGYKDKEMWLGLETIHQLTKNGEFELRVDMSDWQGNLAYAKYGQFSVGNIEGNYTLSVSDYSGTAGDSLKGRHNGHPFSTYDAGSSGCAISYKGGWWYGGCHHANLNGIYYKGSKFTSAKEDGTSWYHWKNTFWNSLKTVEMKFRKKN